MARLPSSQDRSVTIARNDLGVIARAEGPHRVEVDRVLDEPDRAVHEQEVPAARMSGVESGRARVGPIHRILATVDDDGGYRRPKVLAAKTLIRVVNDLGIGQDADPAT